MHQGGEPLVSARQSRYQRAMRNLVVTAAVAIGVVGCAASARTVAVAKTAQYRGDPLVMFAAARTAVAAKYKLASSDETQLRIETADRWYTPDGLGASERTGGIRDVPDRSVNFKAVVKLLPAGDAWKVSVDAVMLRYFTGRPNPDKLTLDDPSVPGWAIGKVDQLYAAVHDALHDYEVGSLSPPRSPHALPAAGTPPPEATQLTPR
jgi:hypothetical protein